MHLETHLENLSLLMGSAAPLTPVLERLERTEEGFVSTVEGIRVAFALDTLLRVLLVHAIEPAAEEARAPSAGRHGSLHAP